MKNCLRYLASLYVISTSSCIAIVFKTWHDSVVLNITGVYNNVPNHCLKYRFFPMFHYCAILSILIYIDRCSAEML